MEGTRFNGQYRVQVDLVSDSHEAENAGARSTQNENIRTTCNIYSLTTFFRGYRRAIRWRTSRLCACFSAGAAAAAREETARRIIL